MDGCQSSFPYILIIDNVSISVMLPLSAHDRVLRSSSEIEAMFNSLI